MAYLWQNASKRRSAMNEFSERLQFMMPCFDLTVKKFSGQWQFFAILVRYQFFRDPEKREQLRLLTIKILVVVLLHFLIFHLLLFENRKSTKSCSNGFETDSCFDYLTLIRLQWWRIWLWFDRLRLLKRATSFVPKFELVTFCHIPKK